MVWTLTRRAIDNWYKPRFVSWLHRFDSVVVEIKVDQLDSWFNVYFVLPDVFIGYAIVVVDVRIYLFVLGEDVLWIWLAELAGGMCDDKGQQ